MMGENSPKRTVHSKRNIVYGSLQTVISLILPFIVRTIIIYRFGANYLGLNSFFTSIISVLSLMDLGFSTAVVYSMYKPIADGDNNLLCAYTAYYKKVYRIIGLAILALGLALMPFLKKLICDPTLPGELNLYICYLIFLGNAVVSYLLYGYLSAIPIAHQRRDLLNCVDIGMIILKCLIQSLILLFTSFFYLYLVSILAVTIMRNLIVMLIVKAKYPNLECKGDISRDQKHLLNRKVYGLMINRLTNVSRNSIDCMCISAFIGLTVTGMFANYFFVVTTLAAFGNTICNSIIASVGNCIATESREKNYSDMRLFDFIYTAISGWATVCMICLYQPFISTWLGDKMILKISVPIGLSIYFYILKSGDIRWVYHEGAGLWYECRFIMFGEAIANIVLNVLLCKIMGVFGIVLATIISVFITNCILCPRLIFKVYFKSRKLTEYWFDHLSYTVTMVVSCVLSWMMCEMMLQGTGFVVLAGRLLICSAISAVVFWFVWHKSDRYEIAVRWITYIATPC